MSGMLSDFDMSDPVPSPDDKYFHQGDFSLGNLCRHSVSRTSVFYDLISRDRKVQLNGIRPLSGSECVPIPSDFSLVHRACLVPCVFRLPVMNTMQSSCGTDMEINDQSVHVLAPQSITNSLWQAPGGGCVKHSVVCDAEQNAN